MKKIINGRRYDTETATEVGHDWNGRCTDFYHWRETLYQKKTGEFFLLGEGGPLSKYGEACGSNTLSDGCKIIPLSYQEATAWAEEHLTGDEYEAIFGEVEE